MRRFYRIKGQFNKGVLMVETALIFAFVIVVGAIFITEKDLFINPINNVFGLASETIQGTTNDSKEESKPASLYTFLGKAENYKDAIEPTIKTVYDAVRDMVGSEVGYIMVDNGSVKYWMPGESTYTTLAKTDPKAISIIAAINSEIAKTNSNSTIVGCRLSFVDDGKLIYNSSAIKRNGQGSQNFITYKDTMSKYEVYTNKVLQREDYVWNE